MRDGRTAPFCFQTLDCTALIRKRYTGKERNTALGIYQAFTELANEYRHQGGRNGFRVTRSVVADFAGVTVRTLDRYAKEFGDLGLLEVERAKSGKLNLPNLWVLTTPLEEQPATPPGRSQPHPVEEQPTAPLFQENGQEEREEPPLPPQDPIPAGVEAKDFKPDKRVDKRPVSAVEWTVAAAALGAFNEALGRKFTLGRWMDQIVRRIREHPELSKTDHVALVTRTCADPWWKDDPGPGVLWGNERIFERCLNARVRQNVDNWGRAIPDYDRAIAHHVSHDPGADGTDRET